MKCYFCCCHKALLFFPGGLFLTLTSRVYQTLQDIEDRSPNSLSSQVSKKINSAPQEPVFSKMSKNANSDVARTAGSCLSAAMTSVWGLVTGTAGWPLQRPGASPVMRSRVVRNIGIIWATQKDVDFTVIPGHDQLYNLNKQILQQKIIKHFCNCDFHPFCSQMSLYLISYNTAHLIIVSVINKPTLMCGSERSICDPIIFLTETCCFQLKGVSIRDQQ